MNLVKTNEVYNQYCEMVDLKQINFDKADSYKYLDIKVLTGRKYVNFILIYTEERIAVIGVTSNAKDILGSFSLQGSGYADQ
jgi:hypothetical protein